MGKYDNYGSDEKLQSWVGSQQTNVTKAMMEGGGPLRRAMAGGAAYARSKMKSPWAEDDNLDQNMMFRGLSKGLRLFGKTKQAEWIDRFTATTLTKKTPKQRKAEQDDSQAADRVAAITTDVKKELTTIKGSLVRIESNIGILSAAVLDTREDVTDIKKLLMPTNLVAEGSGEKYGEQQFVQYNPLAPKGAQFLKQQTLEIEGEPVRGKLINRAPDEEFMQSAIRMAAVETASTILRIQRKDEQKKTKLERRRSNLADDMWAYKDPTETDRDFFKKLTGEKTVEPVKAKEDGIMDNVLEGAIGGAIGAVAPGILKRILGGLLGAGGILGPALIAAAPLAFMGLFTKWAETADINNPGNNPLAVLGAWALKLSQKLSGETIEEGRQRRVEEDRALRDRASRGEIDMSVAQGKAPPGMHWEGNKLVADSPASTPKMSAEQIEALRGVAAQMRDQAANMEGLSETQRAAMLKNAEDIERKINQRGELQTRKDEPKTVKDFIVAGANRAGMDPAMMLAMAAQESSFNPNAQAATSSAKGLFQFIDETWTHMKRKYGGEFTELDKGPFDPEASALAGALYARENAEFLKSSGLPVNATSLYTAHFLGPGGAKKLLEADPNKDASELLPAAARSNTGMFMKKQGGKWVPRTVGELQELLYQKIGSTVSGHRANLAREYGGYESYKQYGVTPRWDGEAMDADSRMLADAQRNGGQQPAATVVVNNTPARTPPPPASTTVPRATGLTSDPTLRNIGADDSVLPAPS